MLSTLLPPGAVRAVILVAVASTELLVLPDGATGTEGALLPRVPVPPGETPGAVLAALGTSVLGDAWRYGGPPVQVGYLRLVTGEQPDARADAELAVRWRWPGMVRPPVPAEPARWADAGRVRGAAAGRAGPAGAPSAGVVTARAASGSLAVAGLP